MKRPIYLVLLLLLLVVSPALSQGESSLSLRLRRDFGFGAGTSIRGTFSYRIDGPDDLAQVQFLIDDEVIGEDTDAPFRWQFNTKDYDLGVHTLSAIGYTTDGRTLQSNTITREFISGGDSSQFTGILIVVILVLVVGGRLISARIANRGQSSTSKQADSGPLGGTICPRCGRPYAIHIWSLNLIAGRIDRCPHCKKWAFVHRANPDALVAANEPSVEPPPSLPAPDLGSQNDLDHRLDDSRYDDQ